VDFAINTCRYGIHLVGVTIDEHFFCFAKKLYAGSLEGGNMNRCCKCGKEVKFTFRRTGIAIGKKVYCMDCATDLCIIQSDSQEDAVI